MQKTVVIVAAGSGNRMQSEMPKQFIELNGLPILMHTILRFYNCDNDFIIRLVLPENQVDLWEALCLKHSFALKHEIFTGGATRYHSVKNGLGNLPDVGLVAIHDGVRPLVDNDTINRCFMAAEEYGAAIPVIDVHETLRQTDGNYSYTVDRKKFKQVQTPQVFDAYLLLEAYKQDFDESFTDDASVVESANRLVMLVEGNRKNIKITTPVDLLIAKALLDNELEK